ncbi:unnamed protein product [Urochloa humidicola]
MLPTVELHELAVLWKPVLLVLAALQSVMLQQTGSRHPVFQLPVHFCQELLLHLLAHCLLVAQNARCGFAVHLELMFT